VTGYQALRESAALVDLTGRGWIRATGEDRVRFLHNLSTNHIKDLVPGKGCRAFFLTAQGRIVSDASVLCETPGFLLDCSGVPGEKLYAHLNKYVIADDVEFADLSAETAILGIEGPAAADALVRVGAPVPQADCDHARWGERLVARLSYTGQPGFRIYAPLADRPALLSLFRLPVASLEEAERVRVENGKPLYGKDFDETNLPQETQQAEAVHPRKGCYLGQEIVERVRARGHVNWLLVALRLGAEAAAGDKVYAGDKEVGELRSVAGTAALALLRAEVVRPGAELVVAGATARIS
jgi:aminomethyltransferase